MTAMVRFPSGGPSAPGRRSLDDFFRRALFVVSRPPPRPLTLASSLRMGPRGGGGLLRKSLHVERSEYHVTTQPTADCETCLSRGAHTLNSKANTTRITRHKHTRRTSTGATRSALDHFRACKQPASCGDGSQSGCSRLTSGACAAKSLCITRHLPGRGCGGLTGRWRAAGAGLVCGTAAHREGALSATKS